MKEEQQWETVEELHKLVPEYPKYHWRHLHSEIKDASKENMTKKIIMALFKKLSKGMIKKSERI